MDRLYHYGQDVQPMSHDTLNWHTSRLDTNSVCSNVNGLEELKGFEYRLINLDLRCDALETCIECEYCVNCLNHKLI